MNPKIDWIIHLVANGVCGACGGEETEFLPNLCNAHTHGMERYGHLDFQMVLCASCKEIGRILNTLGLRVQSGERFRSGDMVSGIYEDCDVRLDEYEETGRRVLRVIIPDADNIFPEDGSCKAPYCHQILKTDELYVKRGTRP